MPELSVLIRGYKGRLAAIAQGSAEELAGRVVRRTPVDTGALRRSWSPTKPFRSLSLGDTTVFFTDLPYARRIEYGHSPQQPNGMLRRSVAEWPQIVASEVRRAGGS